MGAEITETIYDVVPNFNGRIMKFKYMGTTTSDWVIFPNPIGAVKANTETGADVATLYAVSASNNGEVASATATTLTAATFVANERPVSGYIRIDDEIVKYSGATKSSTSGDLTLDERGCFGTTAASHTTALCYVLNTIVFTGSAAGFVRGIAEIIDE